MNIGVIFPQTEFGNDPAAIRAFAETAESLGFDHIMAYDHVLGADSRRTDRPKGPYTHETPFHEPFVLFAYMAAVTRTIELATGGDHPAAAADSDGREADGGARHSLGWEATAGEQAVAGEEPVPPDEVKQRAEVERLLGAGGHQRVAEQPYSQDLWIGER